MTIAIDLAARLPKLNQEIEEALREAQDLAWDAWEAVDSKRAIALAQKALEISPWCIDAYNIIMQYTVLPKMPWRSTQGARNWAGNISAKNS